MNGKGIYHYASGEKYTGDFVDDKKNGLGVHTWPDGKRYEIQGSLILGIFFAFPQVICNNTSTR